MTSVITAQALRETLHGSGEIGLLDVREPGQMAEGHILFSVPLPYSRFELGLADLAPNRDAPLVLCDAGDGVATRAARRAEALGHSDVAVLEGGVRSWSAAGRELFDGVNVPSKVFGEMVEHAAGTPRLSAAEVARRRAAGERMVIVDGRPPDEFRRMNVPGAVCCPNGELALRIDRIAPDPETTIVVNCAGRTRSIIGAQTLIDLGLPNPIYALENGTQGWTLAGLELEHGHEGALPTPAEDPTARRGAAEALAARAGAKRLDRRALRAWLIDRWRTLYLFDIRSDDELAADATDLAALRADHRVVHAPGGQLVQATDRWIGVRRARIVVLDTEGVRAPVIAAWLARLGHEAATVEGGLAALSDLPSRPTPVPPRIPSLPALDAHAVAARLRADGTRIIDLRASADYRAGHIPGALWSVRPRIASAADAGPHVLVVDDRRAAELAAIDLRETGVTEIATLAGGFLAWRSGGMPIEASPDRPTDAERIDFVFHTHDRHEGNHAASQAYLDWEIGLIARLAEDERATFRPD